MLTYLVQSISLRQVLNGFIWVVSRDTAGHHRLTRRSALLGTSADYRCVFLSNLGDHLNEEDSATSNSL